MRPADPGQAPGPAAEQLLVCFELRGQELALPIAAVKETVALRPITPVPLCPPSVAGLVNLRGDVVAVLDPAVLLGLPAASGAPEERRIVLLRGVGGQGHRALCGLLVDRLTAAQRLPPGALRPAPPSLGGAAAYLAGVARAPAEDGGRAARLLLILDPQRLLDAEELRPFRRQPGPAAGDDPRDSN